MKNIFKRGFSINEDFIDSIKYLNSKEKSYLKKKFGFKFDFLVFLKKILKQIFSVTKTENKSHKIVTILGFKIKFKIKHNKKDF